LKKASDFGELLRTAADLPALQPSALQASAAAQRYDSEWLIRDEDQREADRQEQITLIRKHYMEGPVLILPVVGEMNYSFNPGGILALNDDQLYYPSLRFTSGWGTLDASGGALVIRKAGEIIAVQVPLQKADALEGEGWKLALKQGWQLTPATRKEDQTVKQP
jgi:hypothetical protein